MGKQRFFATSALLVKGKSKLCTFLLISMMYCLLPIDSASATTTHILFHESPCCALSIHLHSSSSPVIFLYPFLFSSTNPEVGSVLLSGSKLCFFLQVAPLFSSCPSVRFSFYFFLTPSMQTELCLFTETNTGVSRERSGEMRKGL